MPRSLPRRISAPLLVAIALSGGGIGGMAPAQAQPIRGGLGGPASGAGVLPGAGFGQAGPGLVRPAPVAPAAGGVGGPASGAGVLPGAGFGRPGLGR
jgi:hypothetical protein